MRRFFRLILSRRFFVRVAFCALTLSAVVAVAYSVEKWRGQRAWDAYAQSAGKSGVKLWPEEFKQTEIANAENYAAAPCIREIEKASAEKRVVPYGLSNLRSNDLESFQLEISATRSSLAEVRDFFVRNKELTNPSGDPAKDVVDFLAAHAPALQQLREVTPRRFCRFSTNWGAGIDGDRQLIDFLLNAALLFQISSSARLATGDVAGAADEIWHLVRLSEVIRSEPGLLASVFGVPTMERVASAISEGLITGQWTDADLQRFEEQLASFNPLEDLAFGLNSHRAFANLEYNRIAEHGYVNPFPNARESALMKVGLAIYPSGWVRQNMVKSNEYFDYMVEQIKAASKSDRPQLSYKLWTDAWSQRNLGKSTISRAYLAFVSSMVYMIGGNELGYISAQSHIAQTRLACALERYYRAKGAFPEKVEDLVPAFLPHIPQTLDAKLRIHYVREKGNGYVLWETVGKDQGESPSAVSNDALKDASWVWRRSEA